MKRNRLIICISVVYILLVIGFNVYELKELRKIEYNYNQTINSMLDKDADMIEVLSGSYVSGSDNLGAYGVDMSKDSAILANEGLRVNVLVAFDVFALLAAVLAVCLYVYTRRKQERNIWDIIRCLEEINKKNYNLSIEDNSEESISILKNELMKTTIELREQAELSASGKMSLKNSLEDIAHQIKTPLTSMRIYIDNILDNDMDEKTRRYFLGLISREMDNINSLVQVLLKLSRLDADAVTLARETVSVSDIIETSVTKVEALCDLKNIALNIKCDKDIHIIGDKLWLTEAITNILKNSVEHSEENTKVDIECSENNVYTLIRIKDYGCGMTADEIEKLFTRFYHGEHTVKDSTGIGLSLAKSIIEKSNGRIEVEAREGEGSEFRVKMFK